MCLVMANSALKSVYLNPHIKEVSEEEPVDGRWLLISEHTEDEARLMTLS